jgi:hypothetical protein
MPYLVRAGGFQAALVKQHRALSGGSGARSARIPYPDCSTRSPGGEIALLCRHGSPTTPIPTLPVLKIAELVHCCGVQDRLPAGAGTLATLARYLHLSNLIEICGSSRPMLGFSRRNSARAVCAAATKLPSSSLALIQYSKSGRPCRKTKSFVLMAGDD